MATSSRLYAVALACLGLAGCSSAGQVYALNEAAARQAAPAITFGSGLAGGTISVVMPDGARLEGQYTLIASPNVGLGCDASCSGARAAFATDQLRFFPGARPALAVATDGRGGSMTCRLAVDLAVHGAGFCRTGQGENYRVMF
ncbi:MAG: hypothetical protein J0H14_07750 [Alphaproteobacteria bacterium]|nr:hypothetical protein [Alphaproteobacteria bacterium]